MGGACEGTLTQDNFVTDYGQIPIKTRTTQQIEEYLQKISPYQGPIDNLKIHPKLRALLEEFNESIDLPEYYQVWKMNQMGVPLYMWVANQKMGDKKMLDKRSLLSSEVKILFSESLIMEMKSPEFKEKPKETFLDSDIRSSKRPEEEIKEKLKKLKEEQDYDQDMIMAYYHGNTKDGFAHSPKGIYLHGEGRVYQGTVVNSKANNFGVFENREINYKYEGYWNDDLPHLEGIQKYGDYVFEGTFQHGNKEGKGKLNCGKYKYSGYFHGNRFQGYGNLDTKEDYYEGNFLNGLKHGQGTWKSKNTKQTYEGYFENGMKSGHGVFTFENGYRYEGNFSYDQMDGPGKIFKDEKLIHEGVWVNGKNFI